MGSFLACICAAISPYRKTRNEARKMVGENFIEIYVNTPLEKCEERDAKGLYKLAREGVIKEFTGISDPYEVPENPEIVIDSGDTPPDILVEKLYETIKGLGYI